MPIHNTFAAVIRYALSLLLLVGIVSHTLRLSGTFAHFGWHQKTIATTLCVKKAEVNNTCQGKCHLKKKLAEAQKSTETPAAPKTDRDVVMPLFVPETTCSL